MAGVINRESGETALNVRVHAVSAFTLIELVSVISIMLLLLGLAVTASIGWGRGAAMRTSHKMVLSSLSSARQQAIAGGKTVDFSCTNRIGSDRGRYVLFDKEGDLGNTNSLARGIVFASNTQLRVRFRSDGTCFSSSTNRTIDIILEESSGPLSATIKVYTATGHSTIAR